MSFWMKRMLLHTHILSYENMSATTFSGYLQLHFLDHFTSGVYWVKACWSIRGSSWLVNDKKEAIAGLWTNSPGEITKCNTNWKHGKVYYLILCFIIKKKKVSYTCVSFKTGHFETFGRTYIVRSSGLFGWLQSLLNKLGVVLLSTHDICCLASCRPVSMFSNALAWLLLIFDSHQAALLQ